jgi:hypothetical protein
MMLDVSFATASDGYGLVIVTTHDDDNPVEWAFV